MKVGRRALSADVSKPRVRKPYSSAVFGYGSLGGAEVVVGLAEGNECGAPA